MSLFYVQSQQYIEKKTQATFCKGTGYMNIGTSTEL